MKEAATETDMAAKPVIDKGFDVGPVKPGRPLRR